MESTEKVIVKGYKGVGMSNVFITVANYYYIATLITYKYIDIDTGVFVIINPDTGIPLFLTQI